MKKDYSDKHTFVICAYKESAFLEECIESLEEQTVTSTIIMVRRLELRNQHGKDTVCHGGTSG